AQFIARGLRWLASINPATGAAELGVRSPPRTQAVAGVWTSPATGRPVTLPLPAWADRPGRSLGAAVPPLPHRHTSPRATPWHAGSLGIAAGGGGQLHQDYSGTEATTWDDADENTRNTTLAHVHRRFRLDPAWTGGSYKNPDADLPLGRVV